MNPEREIRKLLKEFIRTKDNLVLTDRMFVAISVLNWALQKTKDKNLLQYYLNEVKRHLNGEITLYWENGVVRVHRGNK